MLPFSYAIRNLFRDKARLLQTVGGSALVVLLVGLGVLLVAIGVMVLRGDASYDEMAAARSTPTPPQPWRIIVSAPRSAA